MRRSADELVLVMFEISEMARFERAEPKLASLAARCFNPLSHISTRLEVLVILLLASTVLMVVPSNSAIKPNQRIRLTNWLLAIKERLHDLS